MTSREPSLLGYFLIACGMVFLTLALGTTLVPMSTVSFGPITVGGITEFSALGTFVGIVLIAMGATVSLRKRPF